MATPVPACMYICVCVLLAHAVHILFFSAHAMQFLFSAHAKRLALSVSDPQGCETRGAGLQDTIDIKDVMTHCGSAAPNTRPQI